MIPSMEASLAHDTIYGYRSMLYPGKNWIVFGDSWSAAREGDTGIDGGWRRMIGIPARNHFAISGTTAREWADDKYGRLTEVIKRSCELDGPIVFSLVGNDIRHAAEDGVVSVSEMFDAYRAVKSIVRRFPRDRHLVMLMYCDPYFGRNKKAMFGVYIMNRICELATFGRHNVQRIYTSKFFTEADFDGKDFHPTRVGWKRFVPWLERRVGYWEIMKGFKP